MTTATLSRRIIRPVATRPARRSMLVGFGATLAIGLLLLVAASVAIGMAAGSDILSGVNVAGVELAGLDRAAAAQRLAEELPALDAGRAVVTVGDTEVVVPYADLGRGYETEAMVDAAFGVGRSGNPIADGIDRLRSLIHPATLPVAVHAYDADALSAISADVAGDGEPAAARGRRPARRQHLRRPRERRRARPGRGRRCGRLECGRRQCRSCRRAGRADRGHAATGGRHRDGRGCRCGRGRHGRRRRPHHPGADEEEPLVVDAETIAAAISFGPLGAEHYAARIDSAAITAAVAARAEDVNRAPVNARIAVAAGGGLGGVVPAEDGRRLDVAASSDGLLDVLARRAGGAAVGAMPLVVEVTQPALTTAEAEAVLPADADDLELDDLLRPRRGQRLRREHQHPGLRHRRPQPGARRVVQLLGQRRADHRGTRLHLRRRDHQRPQHARASPSAAASARHRRPSSTRRCVPASRWGSGSTTSTTSIAIPTGSTRPCRSWTRWMQDMTFRNDTDNPIVVRGFGGNGSVTFQIWSVPARAHGGDHRCDHQQPPSAPATPPSSTPAWLLAPASRVEYPHDGHDVSRSRLVYDAAGNLIHRNDYFSSYATVTGIVAVGPTAAAPPSDDEGETAGDDTAAIGDPEATSSRRTRPAVTSSVLR